jgi:micrococcal nuclease
MNWRVALFIFFIFVLAGAGVGLIITDSPEVVVVHSSPSPQVLAGATVQAVTSKVIRVIDGDTVELEDGKTLRYIGMDTPEIHHPTKGKQCFGDEAKRHNEELVLNKEVTLEKDVNETDRYGRLLRYVWVDDILINKQLVEDGYAFARSYPPDIARQDELRKAEERARNEQRGLWSQCTIMPSPSL